MSSGNYYRVLTSTVMYDKSLTPIEKLLYAEITGLLGANNECFANNKYFAEVFDRSETTISTILNKLATKGYISIFIDQEAGNKRTISIVDPLLKNQKTLSSKIKRGSFEKSKDPLLKNQNSYIYTNNRDIITELITDNNKKINKKENPTSQQNDFSEDFEERSCFEQTITSEAKQEENPKDGLESRQVVLTKEQMDFEEVYTLYRGKEVDCKHRHSKLYKKCLNFYQKGIKSSCPKDILRQTRHYLEYTAYADNPEKVFVRSRKKIEFYFSGETWDELDWEQELNVTKAKFEAIKKRQQDNQLQFAIGKQIKRKIQDEENKEFLETVSAKVRI